MLTSVQISEEDHDFVKKQGLKFSDLMRNAIRERKESLQGIVVDNVFEERRKRETFQKMAVELREKVEELEAENKRLKDGS